MIHSAAGTAATLALAVTLLSPALADAACTPWSFPPYVSLRTSQGRFVAALGGGGRRLAADRAAVGSWEKFRLATVDGSPLGWGKPISLQGWGGQFVVAEPGERLRINRNTVGGWETFVLERARTPPGDGCAWVNVHLRAAGGGYVGAPAGGGDLVASAATAGPSETFAMQGHPGGLDLADGRLGMDSAPGRGKTRWSRLGFGDLCRVGFSEDGAGVTLSIRCGLSFWKGARVEAEVFQASPLKNGWHITRFQVNRGARGALEILERPAEPPIGDVNPHTIFAAECPAATACHFTIVTHVRGPRSDPKF